MTRVSVGLGVRAYDVVVGGGLIDRAGRELASLIPRRRTVIVTDGNVSDHHGERLAAALETGGISVLDVIALEPGEQAKSWRGLERLCDRLLELDLDREDVLTAFGGGVVGDLTGFAAAIYKRGIEFVQVPTTLLAQVDSSVGGKTAIDTALGKNLIGAFHQPRRVLADLDVLATLPLREVRAGYAEIVKYGLLGDAEFFAWLEENGSSVLAQERAALTHAVARSVEMKAEIVAEDEREAGRRALLNLGHTFAHALEAETGFGGTLLHGEAVACGCALAFRLSAALELCPQEHASRATALLAAAHLPTRLSEIEAAPFAAERLVRLMTRDKKASAGALTLVLARRIGDAFVSRDVTLEQLTTFLIEEGARPA